MKKEIPTRGNFIVKEFLRTNFYWIKKPRVFFDALQQMLNQIGIGGSFASDNLFTYGKNLSFLHDERFVSAFEAHAENTIEQSLIWRVYVLCWAARRALAADGDFVECGCYTGTTSRILVDYLDFATSDKSLYLYDMFDHSDDMKHHAMPDHGEDLYDSVCSRFEGFSNVHVVQGSVPGTLAEISPDRIAYLHIDMNNIDAEVGALDLLFDRISTGSTIVLDDYGWLSYQDQKVAHDNFFDERGYQVLELPTGQGLVIK